jgi:phenylalanyl-tRNA synthetase beta chain
VADYLAGLGFNEMMTNSITNAAYFSDEEKQSMVTMTNSLSAELNILRNSLFETALEVVAHNLNHKNNSLRLFEFGKAYSTAGAGKPASPAGRYNEAEKLCIVISGNKTEDSWKQKSSASDFYLLKGTVDAILKSLGVKADSIEALQVPKLDNHIVYKLNLPTGQAGNTIIAGAGEVKKEILTKFGIKQPVFFAGLNWQLLAQLAAGHTPVIKEIPKYPAVQRDLAMVVAKELAWEQVQQSVQKIKLSKLQDVKLFDIFESEKLGAGKKSVAVNFTFLDEEKTLTDKEIDGWMSKIMTTLEKDLSAEIRK